MRIDASRVCRVALGQQPADKDLGAALVFAANHIYRKRSAEIGLAVLKLVEQYSHRYEKTRLEILSEFAEGKVSIERVSTRFPMLRPGPTPGSATVVALAQRPASMTQTAQAGLAGAAELVAMGYRLLSRAAVRGE